MDISGLLLRLMLLLTLVLNAPALARASVGINGQSGDGHFDGPHEIADTAASATPACCDDRSAAACSSNGCECVPASVAVLPSAASLAAWPLRAVPGDALRPGHPAPALPHLIRPPIA
ncbi:CopL family metal-binding regulatory protein [Stenotrophomonas indicatrix]|uniref:CopL family metal-binding regulatory protein n=1 Tax=Stenotrophomonas indicatrix TaxID=2045451 RepID=UPI00215A5A9C|nr:CopL family metal-binding regulatory protein [Stenotrophomonas indicatrix]MCR8713483.1 CopL family metal-binding regulatory protein [Stenotrophomonas indicatrix]